MATKTLQDIAAKMKKLDIAMLTTSTEGGALASRPMSNNGDVEYNGHSYYFTFDSSRVIADIKQNANVNLAFEGEKELYISITGLAELIYDRERMEEHWVKDLEVYFERGIDTPGIVMIRIRASRIKYWQGEEAGELDLT